MILFDVYNWPERNHHDESQGIIIGSNWIIVTITILSMMLIDMLSQFDADLEFVVLEMVHQSGYNGLLQNSRLRGEFRL